MSDALEEAYQEETAYLARELETLKAEVALAKKELVFYRALTKETSAALQRKTQALSDWEQELEAVKDPEEFRQLQATYRKMREISAARQRRKAFQLPSSLHLCEEDPPTPDL